MEPSPSSATGNESPPLRSTILPSFLRRPRGPNPPSTSANPISRDPLFLLEDLPPATSHTTSQSPGHHRRVAVGVPSASQPSVPPTVPPAPLGLTQMLRRKKSTGIPVPLNSRATSSSSTTAKTYRIRFVPHLDSRRTLRFEPICRELREGDPALRIGRFTDRSGLGLATVKLAFKSKVVSRAHAEVWVDIGGRFMIKDTKSSSGTFLNHVRLSAAGTESKPFPLKDGDILQLGVDYQGGTEDIYKSVKIRIELGREWQAAPNVFNTNALKNLKTLAATTNPASSSIKVGVRATIPDCCICLFAVTIRQALFIAPCSHTFHFKCIKPLLDAHHPAFSCPLCRTFADLDEDVEVEGVGMDGFEVTDLESGSENEAENQANISTPIANSVPLPAAELGLVVSPSAASDRDRDAGIETEVEGDIALAQSPSDVRQIAENLYDISPRLVVAPPMLELHEAVASGAHFDGHSGANEWRLIPLSAASRRTNEPPPSWHEGDLEAGEGGIEVSSDDAVILDHLAGRVSHWNVGGNPNFLPECDDVAEDISEALGRAETLDEEDGMTGATRRRVSLQLHP